MSARSIPTSAATLSVTATSGPVVGSLCTGYGGLDLGVLAALGGGSIAWCADPDPHIATLLAHRMPASPNLGDLRSINWRAADRVDVVTAGFPCQDISGAGRRKGIEKGERSGLWTDIVAGLRVLRPPLFVVENVAALRWRNGGLHRVLGDLAEAGYDAAWRSVRASDIGAPHRRERVFLLAWPHHDHIGAAHTHRARRRLQRNQRGQQAGRPLPTGPSTATADTDGVRRQELHPPNTAGRTITARPNTTSPHPTSLGHRDTRTASRNRMSTTAVATDPAARGVRGLVADTASDRRHEGVPGTTRFQRRPDAALSSHPSPHQPWQQLLTDDDTTRNDEPSAAAGDHVVDWGIYATAIHRWERILRRRTPFPTQPGKRGGPVLSPGFVEHLMGLPVPCHNLPLGW
ncbi:DNA cytosine methyltransferase [Saccharopolyspora sp. NPDC050389]|uniref:DNA cytosine methyltransferase n=1 Tax=Saccharopolyspora sp. NPDC050389 TaxID=3155516 RepID=UPI0033D1A672